MEYSVEKISKRNFHWKRVTNPNNPTKLLEFVEFLTNFLNLWQNFLSKNFWQKFLLENFRQKFHRKFCRKIFRWKILSEIPSKILYVRNSIEKFPVENSVRKFLVENYIENSAEKIFDGKFHWKFDPSKILSENHQ